MPALFKHFADLLESIRKAKGKSKIKKLVDFIAVIPLTKEWRRTQADFYPALRLLLPQVLCQLI